MGVVGGGRSLVDRADVRALGVESGIGLRGQPITEAMWFEVGLFFKGLRGIEWVILEVENSTKLGIARRFCILAELGIRHE